MKAPWTQPDIRLTTARSKGAGRGVLSASCFECKQAIIWRLKTLGMKRWVRGASHLHPERRLGSPGRIRTASQAINSQLPKRRGDLTAKRSQTCNQAAVANQKLVNLEWVVF